MVKNAASGNDAKTYIELFIKILPIAAASIYVTGYLISLIYFRALKIQNIDLLKASSLERGITFFLLSFTIFGAIAIISSSLFMLKNGISILPPILQQNVTGMFCTLAAFSIVFLSTVYITLFLSPGEFPKINHDFVRLLLYGIIGFLVLAETNLIASSILRSLFSEKEFSSAFNVKSLCQKLKDNDIAITDNNLTGLNNLLEQQDFYIKAIEIMGDTRTDILEKFISLYDSNPNENNLIRLNRKALEECFPRETPKKRYIVIHGIFTAEWIRNFADIIRVILLLTVIFYWHKIFIKKVNVIIPVISQANNIYYLIFLIILTILSWRLFYYLTHPSPYGKYAIAIITPFMGIIFYITVLSYVHGPFLYIPTSRGGGWYYQSVKITTDDVNLINNTEIFKKSSNISKPLFLLTEADSSIYIAPFASIESQRELFLYLEKSNVYRIKTEDIKQLIFTHH